MLLIFVTECCSIFSTDPSIDLESDRSQKKQVLSLIIDRDVHMWAIISILAVFVGTKKYLSKENDELRRA